eukprot:TRINITY_DN3608_c0_g1_i13.p1 TRINITY_DN3608_c0_g1~~TRINITY_DN3608_c0_g1_i13.p1  ORF type:complete len:478 (+),score=112.60 TRINITY_DN3608_c0_g1_i13:1167-2600(+)
MRCIRQTWVTKAITVAQRTIINEEDFSSAMGEEFSTKCDVHVRLLPTLKVNSNDLNWLKEQKSSKGSSMRIRALAGDAVRSAAQPRKTSTFYVAPVTPKADPDLEDTEEFKTSPSMGEAVPQFSVYCECGNLCDAGQTQCSMCQQKQEPVEISGSLYIPDNNELKLIWIHLINKEIYCKLPALKIGFNKKEDTEHFKIIQLSGTFIKEQEFSHTYDGKKLYPFNLHIQKKKRQFYAETVETRERWLKAIRKAIGYSSFFNFYDVKGLIGKGSFAEVRAAEHKLAKRKFAVKILKKSQMAEKQLEQARTEIETLRVCQHKNIMRLYEVFENADNTYLVLEYLVGGNLYNYVKEHHFEVPESKAKKFIKSIAEALNYLHTYGIIHRDIKPDNVVLASLSENSDVKIVDFGLARILEPNEMATEPVGTLCYAAPEILLGSKYNRSVDLWSLGVLTYWLLSGCLPFSPDLPEKEIAEYFAS